MLSGSEIFKKLSLRAKLGISLCSIGVMVLVLGSLNIYMTQDNNATLRIVYENEVTPSAILSEMDASLKEVRFRLAGVLLDQLPVVGSRNHLREVKTAIGKQWEQYKELTQNNNFLPETTEMVSNFDIEIAATLAGLLEKMEKAYVEDDKKSLAAILGSDWPVIQTKILKPLGKLVIAQRESVGKAYTQAVTNGKRRNMLGMGALIFALTLSTTIFFIMNRLTYDLSIFAEKISATGNDFLDTSSSLSLVSAEVSEGSAETNKNMELILTAVEELSGMVRLTSDSLVDATAISESSQQAAERGEDEMRQLSQSMKAISESSKKIEQIINVIEDIAFMTNLLALNAAIEAARAGENGKGFAVVADEVRTLSQRSSAAAKDVTALIAESVAKIESGVAITYTNQLSFNEIISSVKKLAALNSQISTASHEQTKGISEISKSIIKLEQATGRNSTSALQVMAASSSMEQKANDLQRSVNKLAESIEGKKAA